MTVSAPGIVLRMDLTGTAFNTPPTYADYSSHLATAGDGQPISITWGRQDEDGEVQPSTCTFVLDNTSGQWTPGNAAADADWDVGVPVNVRLVHNAVTYDRFSGFVDAIEPAFGGVSWSQVQVTCSDATARLGNANGLRSIVLHEMLADSPTYLYPLSEAVGATSAATITGTARTAVRIDGTTGAGQLDFGTDMGMFDGGTGVTTGVPGGPYSALDLPALIPSSGAVTLECWAVMPSAGVNAYILRETTGASGSTSATPYSVWELTVATDGLLRFNYSDWDQVITAASSASVCDGLLHHVVATLDSGRSTMTLYVDGVAVGTASPPALTAGATAMSTLGGYRGFSGQALSGSVFPGTISHFAMYPSALSAARVLAHYQAGVGTGPVERSDQRFSRIAGYGGITTSGLPTGRSTMGGQRTAGLPALESLRLVGRSEGAPAFVSKTGAVTMQARDVRYQAAVAASFTSADVNPDLTVRRDRQGLVNEVTVTNQGGAAQVVKDATSQTRHGRFGAGSFDVALSTSDEALNLGQWEVATGKDPLTRLPALTIDLLSAKDNATVAAALSLGISSKFEVTSMPGQAPTPTFTGFVEGGAEQIGVEDWSIGFFTSPVTLEDSVLVLDSATKGVLDTNVLAF